MIGEMWNCECWSWTISFTDRRRPHKLSWLMSRYHIHLIKEDNIHHPQQHLTIYYPIWPYLTISDHVWPHLTISDHIWSHLTISDHIWPYLTNTRPYLTNIRPYLTISDHIYQLCPTFIFWEGTTCSKQKRKNSRQDRNVRAYLIFVVKW